MSRRVTFTESPLAKLCVSDVRMPELDGHVGISACRRTEMSMGLGIGSPRIVVVVDWASMRGRFGRMSAPAMRIVEVPAKER